MQDQVLGILEQLESGVLWKESARYLLLPADFFSMLLNIAVMGFKEIYLSLLDQMESLWMAGELRIQEILEWGIEMSKANGEVNCNYSIFLFFWIC